MIKAVTGTAYSQEPKLRGLVAWSFDHVERQHQELELFHAGKIFPFPSFVSMREIIGVWLAELIIFLIL
jgi:hypothetical protein